MNDITTYCQPLRHTAIAIAAAVALAGCSMAPKHERPEAPVPASYPEQASGSQAIGQTPLDWQNFVVDPELRRLIQTALDNNRNLRQSLLNVEAARAQYRVQRAERLPGVDAQGTATRQRTPADLSLTGEPRTANNYQVGLGITAFEIDFFGRVRNLSESALQQFLAVEANAQTARIGLVAEVIQAYLVRDGALRRMDITRNTLEGRRKSLELISLRRQAGAATALEYQDAVGLAEQAAAELERVDRERRQTDNALRLLLGMREPGPLALPGAGGAYMLVQDLPTGVPADLLERRPDIVAAESQLRARNADIGAARAAFFPRISLTAFLGSSSTEVSNLFDGGQGAWSFSPQLTLPIFTAGRNQANLDLATVRKDIAVAVYEGTVQTAFREVSDALAANDTLRREQQFRLALAQSSRSALQLAEARYLGGLDTNLRYLDAQRSSFANETALIDISVQRQVALVTLFRTLGGGWLAP